MSSALPLRMASGLMMAKVRSILLTTPPRTKNASREQLTDPIALKAHVETSHQSINQSINRPRADFEHLLRVRAPTFSTLPSASLRCPPSTVVAAARLQANTALKASAPPETPVIQPSAVARLASAAAGLCFALQKQGEGLKLYTPVF